METGKYCQNIYNSTDVICFHPLNESRNAKKMIRLFPEYHEISRLLFSFRHEFFNTRFGSGKVIAQICYHLHEMVEIEIFCTISDQPYLELELRKCGIGINAVRINSTGPPESALSSFMPIFGYVDDILCGLTFPYLINHQDYESIHRNCEEYSRRFLSENVIAEKRMPFEFATARVAANSDIALVSNAHKAHLPWFDENVSQRCYSVPYIEEEPTKDLDVFVIPIEENAWLLTKFDVTHPGYIAAMTVKEILTNAQQRVEYLPALDPIRHDDVNCLPNYANALLVNGVAMVPQFGVPEDETAVSVCGEFGYKTYGIYARQIVESNSIFHCMSKANPRS